MLTDNLYSSLSDTIKEIREHWVGTGCYQYVFGHYFHINAKKDMRIETICDMISDSLIRDDCFLLWCKAYQRTANGLFVTKGGKRLMCYVLKEKAYLTPIELWSLLWQSRNDGKEMTESEIKEYEKQLKNVKERLGLIQKREPATPKQKPSKPKVNEKHEQFLFESGLIMTPMGGKVKNK